MFDKLKKLFTKEKVPTQAEMDNIAKIARAKEKADKEHEPFIAIMNMDVDYDNLDGGSFEFEWNDIFIARLVKAGYQGKEDHDLVDQWFNTVCRNVAMETWENDFEQNDLHPVKSRKLDDGRREYN